MCFHIVTYVNTKRRAYRFRITIQLVQLALGGGAIECYIYDDPNQMFLVQADGASAVTCIGRNADTDGIGGSTTTGVSTRELDSSTIATTQALQLKIVGVGSR